MEGNAVKAALKRIADSKEEVVREMKKNFDREVAKAVEPFVIADQEIRKQCPHEYEYEWTHPHNGDDYYQCKFCGHSKR